VFDRVKELLRSQAVSDVVIIDDAFDDSPYPGDLAPQLWARFFDDMNDADEALLTEGYGTPIAEAEGSELQRDPKFVKSVWESRDSLSAAEPLFEDYARERSRKLADLAPLQTLISELDLECKTFGREGSNGVVEAQIVFLDLFLGFVESDEAVNAAIARLKEIMARRRANPPIVVLLSHNPSLLELGPRVRDQGELLGCQFRMLRKADLKDRQTVTEEIYDLVRSHPDALKLNSFINAWGTALDETKSAFLASVRTWDLVDYANTHALRLQAEKEPVGDYALDLLDQHLHAKLEGDKALVLAAKDLNTIAWDTYPAAQFMPSAESDDMMDGLVFQNVVRTDAEGEIDAPDKVHLGDVFMAPPQPARMRAGRVLAPAPTTRDVYIVLTQACDLQHGSAEQLLLMHGRARPYGKLSAEKSPGLTTQIMKVGPDKYTVDWNPLGPEAWSLKDLRRRLKAGFTRVRRFRIQYALQLQQNFIGKLGRVGLPTELPERLPVSINVWLRLKSGEGRLLASAGSGDQHAVSMTGRTEKGAPIEWLMVSKKLVADLRTALLEVPEANLPGGQVKVAAVRNDPEFYRRLHGSIEIARGTAKPRKPFAGTPYDVLQTLPEQSPVVDGNIASTWAPIVVTLSWK